MKTKIWIILIILWASVLIAEPFDMKVELMGPSYYNVLRVSSFDVKFPHNQPVFFTLNVTNITDPEDDIVQPFLHFELLWNDETLVNSKTRYNGSLIPGKMYPFTNRDIFMESGSGGEHSFSTPSPSIDIGNILDRKIPELRDTILRTGLFPDGRYTFTAQFEKQDGTELSGKHTLTFIVRNPGGLFLINPGVSIGGTSIPTVSGTPLSFRWSSNLIGNNKKFRLVVKEFEDLTMLTPGFVEVNGNEILDVEVTDSFYSDFLDLKEGRYYVWQVSTQIVDPTINTSSLIKSQFYVFKYSAEGDDKNVQNIRNIEFFLINLGNAEIMKLIDSGYKSSGIIENRGRVFSEGEIQAVLQELTNRKIIRIEIFE